ncbi:MAG: flagellar export chaperone FliS [Nitrococcus sp.]|nr:flagellar export chaperone FliS [Nitrococcus sp.]
MTYGAMNRGVAQYRQVGASSAAYADPYELTKMLLEGAIERVSQARHALAQGDIPSKAQRISKAAAIVAALRDTLDMKRGGELAERLDALYEYMDRRLLEGNLKNEAGALEEVASLLREIKDGWDAIPPEARHVQHKNAIGTTPAPA